MTAKRQNDPTKSRKRGAAAPPSVLNTPPISAKEAEAIVAEAQAATPYWKWAPTYYQEYGLFGFVHIGRLQFRIGFYMIMDGKISEIHWGTEGLTQPALAAFQKQGPAPPPLAVRSERVPGYAAHSSRVRKIGATAQRRSVA